MATPLLAVALSVGCGIPEHNVENDAASPLPDAPVRVHAHRSIADREEEIRPTSTVFASDGADRVATQPLFHMPTAVAIHSSGRVFVLDRGNFEVDILEPSGEYVGSFGQRGQGPAEFHGPLGLVVAGDTVIVNDVVAHRLSVWDVDGRHLYDRLVEGGDFVWIGALPDASLAFTRSAPATDRDTPNFTFGRMSADGDLSAQFISLPTMRLPRYQYDGRSGSVPMDVGEPEAATSVDGTVYVTARERYEIYAFDPEGVARWVVRVDQPRQAVSESDKDAAVSALGRFMGRTGSSFRVSSRHVDWPENHPAIRNIEVDGRGYLYVFPKLIDGRIGSPVDVYDRQGSRVFSGMISVDGWDAAFEDSIYRIEVDAPNGTSIVRYDLVRPWVASSN